ncbi:hypothetical protein [Streptomyces sp. NPDC002690]
MSRAGITWEYLPHDFPPCKTVYDHYATWEGGAVTRQLHELCREKPHPSTAAARNRLPLWSIRGA